MLLRLFAVLLVSTCALLVACGGDDGDGDAAGNGNTTATQDAADEDEDDEADSGQADAGSGDPSEIDACGLLSRDEVEAAVGNAVEDGAVDFGISCKWDSEPEETSAAVYFLQLAGELCEQALSDDATYEKTDEFGPPAFKSYNDAGGIGQSDIVVCLDEGQMQLIVTGGFGADPVEDDLRKAAEDLTELVLSRI